MVPVMKLNALIPTDRTLIEEVLGTVIFIVLFAILLPVIALGSAFKGGI